MVSHNFSKQKRLLEAKHFKRVFDSPDKKLSTSYILLLVCKNDLDHPRLGLVIGKKSVKLAVQRNRLKRQIREVFRLNQHLIDSYDVVVVARRGLAEVESNELHDQFIKFWKRLSVKNSTNSENGG